MKKLFLLGFAVALVSCSESAERSDDMALICLRSSGFDAGLSTRSPREGAATPDRPFVALIPSATSSGAYVDNLHALGTMSFTGDAAAVGYDPASLGIDAASKAVFPSAGEVSLYGVYPGEASLWTVDNTTATFTFTGKEDVMTAPEVAVKRSEVQAGVYQTLEFSHLLTRLEVKLKAKTPAAALKVGAIGSIRLVADPKEVGMIKDKLTYNPTADAVTFSASEDQTSLPFYVLLESEGVKTYTDALYAGRSYMLTSTAAFQAYSLVAPVEASSTNSTEYYLAIERVDADGNSNTDYIGFDLMQTGGTAPFAGNTAGYSFSVVVTYTQEYIDAIATEIDFSIGSQDWTDHEEEVRIEN